MNTSVTGVGSTRMCYGIKKHVFPLYGFSSCNPRPNEKKLIDIIEFHCNKLQWYKIYGNLARNFKVNGILSVNFSIFQTFSNSEVYIRVGLTTRSSSSKLVPVVFLLPLVYYLRKHLSLSISN